MSKKSKKEQILKEFEIRDNLKNRNLKMTVISSNIEDFERTSCFFKKVELASKIVDTDKDLVLKNKLSQ